MSTELAKPAPKPKTGVALVGSWLETEKMQRELAAAVQGWMDPSRFKVSLMTYIGRNPKIAECEQSTLLYAVMTMASQQLLPGRQAIIVPRFNKHQQRTEANFTPTFHGLQALMVRSDPAARAMQVVVVHTSEHLEVDGRTMQIVQYDAQPLSRKFRSWDDVQGAFMRIPGRRGEADRVHFVSKDYLQKAASKADPKSTIWSEWLEEMCSKTVIRHAFARGFLLVDPATQQLLEQVFEQDDAALGNDLQRQTPLQLAAASRDLRLLSPAMAAPVREVEVEEPEPVRSTSSDEDVSPDLEIGPTGSTTWDDVQLMLGTAQTLAGLEALVAQLAKSYPEEALVRLQRLAESVRRKLAK